MTDHAPKPPGTTAAIHAEILAWHVAMGAGDALDDTAHDRFAESAAEPASNAARLPPAPETARGGQDRRLDETRALAPTSPAPTSPSPTSPAPQRPTSSRPPPSRPPAPAPARKAAAAVAPDAAALEARDLARKAGTLEELKALMTAFDGCALKGTATTLCFADGDPGARIMFVGEAPGAEEDRAGIPFVGRSGQLLDRMLAAIGLDRARDVYIANVVPWRPPGNRTPTSQEIAICLPFIQRQIALVDPDILVCVGGPSAQALLGFAGILASRGKWTEYDTGSRRIRALATLHPAYLLRQPLQKRLAWRDFRALKAELAKAPPH